MTPSCPLEPPCYLLFWALGAAEQAHSSPCEWCPRVASFSKRGPRPAAPGNLSERQTILFRNYGNLLCFNKPSGIRMPTHLRTTVLVNPVLTSQPPPAFSRLPSPQKLSAPLSSQRIEKPSCENTLMLASRCTPPPPAAAPWSTVLPPGFSLVEASVCLCSPLRPIPPSW